MEELSFASCSKKWWLDKEGGKGDWGEGPLTTTVEGHAASAGKIMLLNALFVDGLLSNDVAGAEEDGGGDGLGEEGPSGQSGLVPVGFVFR